MLDWLSARLPRYKVPKTVIFWTEMPKSAYGKITKKLIRSELISRGDISDG